MRQMDFRNARNVIDVRGRQIGIDSNLATADDIRRISGIKKGRTVMLQNNRGMEALKEGVKYTLPPKAKFKDAPSVRKASNYREANITCEELANSSLINQYKCRWYNFDLYDRWRLTNIRKCLRIQKSVALLS